MKMYGKYEALEAVAVGLKETGNNELAKKIKELIMEDIQWGWQNKTEGENHASR